MSTAGSIFVGVADLTSGRLCTRGALSEALDFTTNYNLGFADGDVNGFRRGFVTDRVSEDEAFASNNFEVGAAAGASSAQPHASPLGSSVVRSAP